MKRNHDPRSFRALFPACAQSVYLDSAATALKPQALIDATVDYYRHSTAAAFRSQSQAAEKTAQQMQKARAQIAHRLNAASDQEIIWTSGATAAINLVAYAFGLRFFNADSEIIVSELEHHSNVIPWIQIAKLTGAQVKIWQVDAKGQLDLDQFRSLLSEKTRFVAITQMSNVTGFKPDLEKIIPLAHEVGAKVLVDGAQGCLESMLDVQKSDVDFYVFSAHKYYGPTGLGILYGKSNELEAMSIWQGGGKMVDSVNWNDFVPSALPYKFEAGTQNIAGIIGFGAVLETLDQFDHTALMKGAIALTTKAANAIQDRFGSLFKIISAQNSHILTFYSAALHSEDIAMILMQQNIVIRSGKLCAHPLIKKIADRAVIRLSILPYNTQEDIEQFLEALSSAIEILT